LQEKDAFEAMVDPAALLVKENLERLDVAFVVPDIQLLALICPSSKESVVEESDQMCK